MKKTHAISLALFLLAIVGCESPLWENYAYLSFPDLAEYKGVMGGQLGSLDFQEVKVGESATRIVKMKNVGPKAIEIAGISFDTKRFDFHGRVPPVFPLRLEPGETTDLLNLAFFPDDNGPLTGRAIIEVDGRVVSLALSGTGYWELTLRINNLGGRIIAPVSVTSSGAGGAKVYKCTEDQVKLVAEIEVLNKLRSWTLIGTPVKAPVFENQRSSETLVEVKSHTTLEAEFYAPFNFFPKNGNPDPAYYDSLQAAINACDGTSKEAVIVQTGTHSIAASVTLKNGASLLGGYNAGFSNRLYLTPEDRANPLNVSALSFAPGAQLIIPAHSSSNTVVEGVTLTHASAGSVPVLSVGEASKAVVRHVTISSKGDKAAVFSYNSNFILRDSLLEGGSGTKESVALDLQGGSKEIGGVKIRPLVYRNTIRAGSAGAMNATTFGIRIEFDCYPTVVGNTIYGGNASGSGGKSHGVHYMNNGRGFFTHNTIDAGVGKQAAIAFLSGQGTNLYLFNNNVSALESVLAYGVYLEMGGRVRRCDANGYKDIDILEYTFLDDATVTGIDELNEQYFIKARNLTPNEAQARTIVIPASPELVP